MGVLGTGVPGVGVLSVGVLGCIVLRTGVPSVGVLSLDVLGVVVLGVNIFGVLTLHLVLPWVTHSHTSEHSWSAPSYNWWDKNLMYSFSLWKCEKRMYDNSE